MNPFDRAVARAVYRVGEFFGEFDDRLGAWHFLKERKGCWREDAARSCLMCQARLIRYQLRFGRELLSYDTRPRVSQESSGDEDRREFVMIEVNSPDRGEGQ